MNWRNSIWISLLLPLQASFLICSLMLVRGRYWISSSSEWIGFQIFVNSFIYSQRRQTLCVILSVIVIQRKGMRYMFYACVSWSDSTTQSNATKSSLKQRQIALTSSHFLQLMNRNEPDSAHDSVVNESDWTGLFVLKRNDSFLSRFVFHKKWFILSCWINSKVGTNKSITC